MAEIKECSASNDAQGAEPKAEAQNQTQAGADDLARLADAATSEGSSINSEDYWFLKLNGNC